MTLREAIEEGLFDLDESIEVVECDPNCPESPNEVEVMASDMDLEVGDRLTVWRGLQCKRDRIYIVTKTRDEDGIDDYELEEVQPDGADPAKPVAVSSLVLSMAVARLGGTVEGQPTARHNFLQLIDELRRIESDRAVLQAEIARRDRYAGADGCSFGDCSHVHESVCLDEQAKVIAEQAAYIDSLSKQLALARGWLGKTLSARLITETREAAAAPPSASSA